MSSKITNFLAPPPPIQPVITNPCVPSPCGPNSECRDIGGSPSCSCRLTFIGSPPNCKPECVINSECPSNLACIREKCMDPCPGSCGLNAECSVINHVPICSCYQGYTGDPFNKCFPKVPTGNNNNISFLVILVLCIKYFRSYYYTWSMQSLTVWRKYAMQRWFVHMPSWISRRSLSRM